MENLPMIPSEIEDQIKLIQEHFDKLSEEELNDNISKVWCDITSLCDEYNEIPYFSEFKLAIRRLRDNTAKDLDYINIIMFQSTLFRLITELSYDIASLKNDLGIQKEQYSHETRFVIDDTRANMFRQTEHINNVSMRLSRLENKLRQKGIIDGQ